CCISRGSGSSACRWRRSCSNEPCRVMKHLSTPKPLRRRPLPTPKRRRALRSRVLEATAASNPDDSETHERLLNAATRLFADRGFAKVTVRDICERANANVAAVNYHFGGKVGLYERVLRSAIQIMQAPTTLAREAGAGKSAEEQLRTYVRIFVQRIVAPGENSWIHQLMMHEMSDPTPALDLVIEQVIKPRMEYLGGIVATLLRCPPDDPRTA